jgi:hypothetical protein
MYGPVVRTHYALTLFRIVGIPSRMKLVPCVQYVDSSYYCFFLFSLDSRVNRRVSTIEEEWLTANTSYSKHSTTASRALRHLEGLQFVPDSETVSPVLPLFTLALLVVYAYALQGPKGPMFLLAQRPSY